MAIYLEVEHGMVERACSNVPSTLISQLLKHLAVRYGGCLETSASNALSAHSLAA